MPFSGMWYRVALVRTKVSRERITSIIRVKRFSELETTSAVTSNWSTARSLKTQLLVESTHYSSLNATIQTNVQGSPKIFRKRELQCTLYVFLSEDCCLVACLTTDYGSIREHMPARMPSDPWRQCSLLSRSLWLIICQSECRRFHEDRSLYWAEQFTWAYAGQNAVNSVKIVLFTEQSTSAEHMPARMPSDPWRRHSSQSSKRNPQILRLIS
jgi:hypothetical protein